jgi:rhodanese-related sulfurtransferase
LKVAPRNRAEEEENQFDGVKFNPASGEAHSSANSPLNVYRKSTRIKNFSTSQWDILHTINNSHTIRRNFTVHRPPSTVLSMDLEITVDQLSQQLSSENPPLLLDVREPWEFQTAQLAHSKLMPMNEVPARAFTELDEDQPIVVLCHHGTRSLSVANWLRQQGFEKAQSVAGGIDLWSRVIDPTIPRY